MISVDIEKEIKGENRIIGKFTIRQVVTILICVIIPMTAYYFIVRPTTTNAFVPPAMMCGCIAYLFGFHKKGGMNTEYFLYKKIKETMYFNRDRAYRTKNKYIPCLNEAIRANKLEKMNNKKEARKLKKENKRKAKKYKRQGKGYL